MCFSKKEMKQFIKYCESFVSKCFIIPFAKFFLSSCMYTNMGWLNAYMHLYVARLFFLFAPKLPTLGSTEARISIEEVQRKLG